MVREFKQITITIHKKQLEKFKQYCEEVKLPLSRFFSLAGHDYVKKGEISGE